MASPLANVSAARLNDGNTTRQETIALPRNIGAASMARNSPLLYFDRSVLQCSAAEN
jgi:hypothetical protein